MFTAMSKTGGKIKAATSLSKQNIKAYSTESTKPPKVAKMFTVEELKKSRFLENFPKLNE